MLRLPLRPNRIDILQEKQKFERDGMTEIDGESSILNFLRYYVYSFLPLFINNPEGRGVQAVLYYYFLLGWACINFYGQMSLLWGNSAFSWGRHRRGVTKVEMFCLSEY